MKENKFLSYFGARIRFSIRSIRSSTETWHINTRRLTLILNSLGLVALLFGAVFLVVIYTPILDIVPGYPGSRSREILLDKLSELDSLEKQVIRWEQYTTNLQMILEGRIVQDTSALGQSNLMGALKRTITPRSDQDSILRMNVRQNLGGEKSEIEQSSQNLTNDFISPIPGEVVRRFNPQGNEFGVILQPKPNSVVQSVKEGTIISCMWDARDGYTILIQHPLEMISKYTNLEKVLYDVGSRVRGGEGIGISQSITEDYTPIFGFELWAGGNAVDPEAFITF